MRPPGDRDDAELRRQFAELRSAEDAERPSFRAVLERAQARRRRAALRARTFGTRAAAVVLVAAGVVAYLYRDRIRAPWPATAADAPVPVRAADVPSLSSWRSPTASLLRTPGSEFLHSLPDLSASVLDRLAPPIPSEGSGS